MTVDRVAFWIQVAIVIIAGVVVVVWIIRYWVMRRRANRYLAELGLKVEVEPKDDCATVKVTPSK